MNDQGSANTTAMDSRDNTRQAEPGVNIPHSALRSAISNAERSVDEIMSEIRDEELTRDHYVRRIGSMQANLDRLAEERERRSAHLRALMAAS